MLALRSTRTILFHPVICVIVLLSLGSWFGCRNQAAKSPANSSPQSGQGVDSARLSQRWEEERAALNKLSKSYPADQLIILESLIEKLPPDQVASEFERIRSSETTFKQMSDFDQNLLQVFVIRYAKQKDRVKLVYLLSGQCPRFVATDGIEHYLALAQMPDPLLILFDSYERAEKEPARGEIIEALGSVFRKLRSEHPDDREFVAASKQWYLSNKDRLKVNPYYQPGSGFSESRDFFINTAS